MHDVPPVDILLERLVEFGTAVSQTFNAHSPEWAIPQPGSEWTLGMVMCHLRDVEREVHQPRFRAVLAEEAPFLSGVDPDQWAISRQYHLADGQEAWESFLAARAETISMLYQLPTADWQRSGNHAFFGTTTLQELLSITVQHDTVHLQQIKALINNQTA